MARPSTVTDVFSAVAGVRHREVLDALVEGEKAVGAIVSELSMSQPQVSKHLRVLSDAGLVRCGAEGRRRAVSPRRGPPAAAARVITKYEQVMSARLDQMDDYLMELQGKGAIR